MPKILILEDSVIVSKLLASLLKGRGYEVVECSTVAEAMENLNDVDCAIIDYKLPDGNGLEVAEKLRRYRPGVSMLLLTARGQRVPPEAAKRAGIKEYLEKPANPENIIALVELYLGRQEAA